MIRRRRLAAFAAVSFVVATVAAVLSVCSVSFAPPGLHKKQLSEAAVTSRAMVAVDPPARLGESSALEGQAKRSDLVANLISSAPVIARIGATLGVDPGDIASDTEVDIGVPEAFTEPDNERRAHQIVQSHATYKLDIQPRPGQPLFDIYAQAPTTARAGELAAATIGAVNAELREMARQGTFVDNGHYPVVVHRLGQIRGGTLESTAPLEIALLTFMIAFAISFGLLYVAVEAVRGWRRGDRAVPSTEPVPRRARDDWPHTTRVLPWLIALFVAMLWLVPINGITFSSSLPVELKLDRVLLPVIALIWLLSMVVGGRSAPRWRFGRVHAAVAVFVVIAFLSVIVNAVYLDHTLELGVAIKKLTLLAAFFTLFLIVASSVRPTEVRPFLTFMVVMGSICAVGLLYEYHYGTNLFYEWSAKIFPGTITLANGTGEVDEIGRRAIIGPAEISLETVAMLSMALPLALVRLLETKVTRSRVLYALATCLMLGAMLATYRKSALLAPVAIILVLIAFRRREMLKLAPLGVLMIGAIPFLVPNALGGIIDQFKPNRLGVATVSDRVSDYDAIRPDLLSHPALGRGYGSYEHTTYRILDNDLLMRLVETGLIGLTAFVAMLLAVVVIAAPIIRARSPEWAGPALAVAAATTAFLVLSVLFDIMSFPHPPYLLMVLLGLFAVVARVPNATAKPEAEEAHRVAVPTLPPDTPLPPLREKEPAVWTPV
jgi:hypothetical protein